MRTEGGIPPLNEGRVDHASALQGCPHLLDLRSRALDDPSLAPDDSVLLVPLDYGRTDVLGDGWDDSLPLLVDPALSLRAHLWHAKP
jgi:hypothetical protein